MRHKRSSSAESTSSSDYKSARRVTSNKYKKKRRSRSKSRSSSHSRNTSSKRRHRSSSSSSSSSSDRSSKKSKKNSRKSRSPDQMASKLSKQKYRTADEDKFKQKFEFNEGIDELYKNNEKSRLKEINKLENDHESGGGFKPRSFKSSRSDNNKITALKSHKKDSEHENAIFGNTPISSATLSKSESVSLSLGKVADSLLSPSVVSSSNKSIMHENPAEGGQAKILKHASDLNSFSFFQRSSVDEFLKFTAKIITERTSVGARSSVKEQDYIAHVYVRGDNLTAVLVSDQEYNKRVAHTLLNKVLDEFTKSVPSNTWESVKEEIYFVSKNPKEADALTKLQLDLDETKIILHGTIESVLQRGEKLDDLVAKSEDLGLQSRTFYKTAKKTNACCSYM